MTPPPSTEDVYDRIYHDAITTCTGAKAADTGIYIENALKEASKKYPFMKGLTIELLFDYVTKKQDKEQIQKWQHDKPTEKDFWDAAYEFDPLRQKPGSGPSRLIQLLKPNRFGVLPLGKLYNDVDLGILPEIGALPESKICAENFTMFPPAASDSGAISYPDGHRSEVITPTDMMKPNQDRILRRFASLGWVVKKSKFKGGTIWTMTGHVLVMDMDVGRDHHPWFILAHEWPSEDNEGPEEDFMFHAPERVQRNASGALGVFPGDNNRTPIAKIVPKDPVEGDTRPILKRFDSNFNCCLGRRGGDRQSVRTEFDAGLAHVMSWYWDETAKEEVCYDRLGKEYMRYHPGKREYRYPNMDHSSKVAAT